ncbi:hypothetical protein J6590_095632 [Homalodisca vitripennis]|nr:hypothetical protein J6590_095632 [Homalodisca vitripennis]
MSIASLLSQDNQREGVQQFPPTHQTFYRDPPWIHQEDFNSVTMLPQRTMSRENQMPPSGKATVEPFSSSSDPLSPLMFIENPLRDSPKGFTSDYLTIDQ